MSSETKTETKDICMFAITPGGIKPTRGTPGSAGWDLYSPETVTVKPGEQVMIPLRLQSSIKKGYYAQIKERSSMAVKRMIVHAGVIDSDYRDEIKVLIANENTDPEKIIIIKAGDKFAQMIILAYCDDDITCIEVVDVAEGKTKLPSSTRVGGFGSTGN